eukprot:168154-Rhodomonas_salina.2
MPKAAFLVRPARRFDVAMVYRPTRFAIRSPVLMRPIVLCARYAMSGTGVDVCSQEVVWSYAFAMP